MAKIIQCPFCTTRLQVHVTLHENDTFSLSHIPDEDKMNDLIHVLHRFWQWKAEGEKKHQEEQYYYNPHRDSIEYDRESGVYRFSIQLYDSPDGDTWWRGSFTVKGSTIQILDNHADRPNIN